MSEINKNEIVIDGETYIKKESENPAFEMFEAPIIDAPNVLAIGTVKLKGKWAADKVSLDYIKK